MKRFVGSTALCLLALGCISVALCSCGSNAFRQTFVVEPRWEARSVEYSELLVEGYDDGNLLDEPCMRSVDIVRTAFECDSTHATEYLRALSNWYAFGRKDYPLLVQSGRADLKHRAGSLIEHLEQTHVDATSNITGYGLAAGIYYEWVRERLAEAVDSD